jgi:hypothetical protein
VRSTAVFTLSMNEPEPTHCASVRQWPESRSWVSRPPKPLNVAPSSAMPGAAAGSGTSIQWAPMMTPTLEPWPNGSCERSSAYQPGRVTRASLLGV